GLDTAPKERIVRERSEPRYDRLLVQRDRHPANIREPASGGNLRAQRTSASSLRSTNAGQVRFVLEIPAVDSALDPSSRASCSAHGGEEPVRLAQLALASRRVAGELGQSVAAMSAPVRTPSVASSTRARARSAGI